MSSRFQGKVAVVTAGGAGIGAATAHKFARERASVVVADISGTRAAEVATAISNQGGIAVPLKMDASDPEGVQAAIRLAVGKWGRLDVMFNNAGLGTVEPLESMALETWNRIIAVTLTSTFLGIKHSLPVMRNQGGGSIVNTASISGTRGDYGMSAYNAAKAGVINLTGQRHWKMHGTKFESIVFALARLIHAYRNCLAATMRPLSGTGSLRIRQNV